MVLIELVSKQLHACAHTHNTHTVTHYIVYVLISFGSVPMKAGYIVLKSSAVQITLMSHQLLGLSLELTWLECLVQDW